ncbi:MAG TPA: amidohydrolase family protein [Gemmatimonadales bacterium]|nr:amidohydrolase family protein [Gemmatimonadales bacterium]
MKRLIGTFITGSTLTASAAAQVAPAADHHQHLFSPAIAALLTTDSNKFQPLTARELMPLLDSAGIRRAVLLSTAYMYGSPRRSVVDEYEKVRAENDWTAAQAAAFPDRLIAFCGFNPLKDYAIKELERCARQPGLRRGIKLHIGNSDVQLDNPEHLEKLRSVFRAANQQRMAIVIHLRASLSRQRPYGARQARLFLDRVLPAAPDIPVQIAHLAGTGPGYDDPPADSAMAVFAGAVLKREPGTARLWFDLTTVADRNISPETAALLVRRIRQVGVQRVLYGSDAAVGENMRPREAWAAFRQLPLTESEFKTIAGNQAPYLGP